MKNLSFIEINSENVNNDVMQSSIALYSALIADRVKRFKQKGIHQWQDNYAERNSQENVTQAILNDKGKKLVVFFDSNNNLVGATMVKSQERPGFWDNGEYDQNIDVGYITGLVSDPKFSGQGAGKAIMKALGEYGKQHGIEKFRLDCRSDSSEESFLVRFYKSCGFAIVGVGNKEATEKFEAYPYTLLEATPDSLIMIDEIKTEASL